MSMQVARAVVTSLFIVGCQSGHEPTFVPTASPRPTLNLPASAPPADGTPHEAWPLEQVLLANAPAEAMGSSRTGAGQPAVLFSTTYEEGREGLWYSAGQP